MPENAKYTNERGEEIYGYLLNSKLMAAAYFDKRLQNKTRCLLGLLISLAYDDGLITHFSIQRTAKMEGVARWAIHNQINKLIEYGYLKKEEETKSGYRNRYKLLYGNYLYYRDVIQLSDTPDVTQLDYTPVTQSDYIGVTSSDYTKKTLENKEIKKEKGITSFDDFLVAVKQEFSEHKFQEIGNIAETVILDQASACWRHWDANDRYPAGNYISSFYGWLRIGLSKKSISEISPKRENAGEESYKEPEPPMQEWHGKIKELVSEAEFRSWIRPLHWDGNGKLHAPSRFFVSHINENFKKQIEEVIPEAKVVYEPLRTTAMEGSLTTEGERQNG